jgi:hypothetical protein
MKVAIGYIRVSSYGQLSTAKKRKTSFLRQAEAINQYAKENGYEVIQYFFDCITGKTPFGQRPGGSMLLKFLQALKDSNLTAEVIVEDMGRFARSLDVVTDSVYALPFEPLSASKLEKIMMNQIQSALAQFFLSTVQRKEINEKDRTDQY